jgi:hypothetical protein
MRSLLDSSLPVVLTVSPDWKELDHLGPVSAHILPGASVACPYLIQGSTVRVRWLSSVMRNDEIGESLATSPPVTLPSKRPRDEVFPQEDELDADGTNQVTPSERRKLRANFRAEAKQARSIFKDTLVQEWHLEHPSIEDKENSWNDRPPVTAEGFSDDEYAFDYFVSLI